MVKLVINIFYLLYIIKTPMMTATPDRKMVRFNIIDQYISFPPTTLKLNLK